MKRTVVIQTPETELEVRAEVDSGGVVFKPISLPCGGTAFLDHNSGIGYRCEDCGCMVGSIGQPKECVEERNKWDQWKALGGKGWDYYD